MHKLSTLLFIDLGVPKGKMKVNTKGKLLLPIFFFVSFSYLSLCAENDEVVKYQRQLANLVINVRYKATNFIFFLYEGYEFQ